MLSFPDRNGGLDAVHEITIRREGLRSVRRARGRHDRKLTHVETPHAVQASQPCSAVPLLDLLSHAPHLTYGHRRVGLVVEPRHEHPGVLSPHESVKDIHGAGTGVCDGREDTTGLERRA
jgi:hypothetical protein